MKPTQFLTQPPCIATQLARTCPGKQSHVAGRHASLFNGRAAKAQVYPEALCDAICQGINKQIGYDRNGQPPHGRAYDFLMASLCRRALALDRRRQPSGAPPPSWAACAALTADQLL